MYLVLLTGRLGVRMTPELTQLQKHGGGGGGGDGVKDENWGVMTDEQ